jgi:hypothetical protein
MNLVDRAKNIMFTPKTEWEVIKTETWSIADLYTKYILILAAIPAVAGFVGYSIFGLSYGFGTVRVGVGTGLTWAILQYVMTLVGVYVLAFIIDVLAPSFGSAKDMPASMKIVAFAYTPAWVAGIFNIIPVLSFIVMLASIYSLVLLYMGMQRLKNVPQDKMIGYFVVVIIAAILVFFLTGLIVSGIAFSGYAFSSSL